MSTAAAQAIEDAARDSWGRLLVFLAMRSRDLATAEDALADAFQAALETWPRGGVPAKPEAWLLTAARRKLLDAQRRTRAQVRVLQDLLAVTEEAREQADSNTVFPDERLKLLFVCAHPAIDPVAHTPLMLQTVLGLDAARIASAFLVKPSTMSQRLSRVKTKIRDAGISFELPQEHELPARLNAVLEAIYAAYGSGWDDVAGADTRRKGLATEALELGRLLLRLMPTEPEVMGLLALMLYCESRREARRNNNGEYVPLSEQDVTRWSRPLLEQADQLLHAAESANRLGPFQLEAAIQAVHARRAVTGRTDWETIALLYEGLVHIAPRIGALVGHAAAVAEARGPADAWGLLQDLPADSIRNYQPYWALAAHLLARSERYAEANTAYERAIGLCEDPATRQFLSQRAQELGATNQSA